MRVLHDLEVEGPKLHEPPQNLLALARYSHLLATPQMRTWLLPIIPFHMLLFPLHRLNPLQAAVSKDLIQASQSFPHPQKSPKSAMGCTVFIDTYYTN